MAKYGFSIGEKVRISEDATQLHDMFPDIEDHNGEVGMITDRGGDFYFPYLVDFGLGELAEYSEDELERL